MDRAAVINTLKAHRQELRELGVRSLRLFGSFARDQARNGSDIDLLVDMGPEPTFRQYCDIRFFLEDLLERSVDLVTEGDLREPIRPFVERDAIRVA